MLRKVITVFLVLIMLMTAFPLTAICSFAAEKSETICFEFDISDRKAEALPYAVSAGPLKSFSGTDSFNFYSFLDSFQKSLYNKILAKKAGLTVAEASPTKSTDTEATIVMYVSLTDAQWDEYWSGGKLSESVKKSVKSIGL